MHAHKEKLTQHLLQKYQSWFGVGFEFLLFDVMSTFFEGQVAGNPPAARVYSRDHRPDCQQVCIGLVVSPEGLPLAYEVFAGNRVDVTTVQEIVTVMEEKYGQAKRVWVWDRGMVSEANLEFLRGRGARYIVGTPKAQLRQFEAALLAGKDWHQAPADPGIVAGGQRPGHLRPPIGRGNRHRQITGRDPARPDRRRGDRAAPANRGSPRPPGRRVVATSRPALARPKPRRRQRRPKCSAENRG